MTTTEETIAEGLVRLFKDNVWKLYELLESVILDKGSQFAVELMKELNRMLGIIMKLSTSFHLQMDGQTKYINNQNKFFINHKQKNCPEWLVTAEFVVNNKVHSVTKVLLFITNYRRELRMGINIRRKEKVEKITKFVKRMKKVQKEVGAVLKKAQKEMKR